ncbi:hypothetical protein ILYODFUR_007164 [Ilyodon furcidens]|uniref:Uncharacterized protein n=1 Tax=Ilyodon furcidens TaxID=33524 RepID=A0ABV0V3X3_9TELE
MRTYTLVHITTYWYSPVWTLCGTFKVGFHFMRNKKCQCGPHIFVLLSPPSLLAAAGLWLVTDPPASVCADFFASCIKVGVYVQLSAPLSHPTSAQIRASVS